MTLKRICFVAMIFALLSFSPGQTRSETENTIRRMESAELDQLIQKKSQRCVVSFMAAWCAPCVRELPILARLCDKYENKGLNLIGVSLDISGPSAMQPIVSRLNVNFPVYWVGEKAISQYQIKSIPLLFLVKDGRIVRQIAGKQSEIFLDRQIRKFLE